MERRNIALGLLASTSATLVSQQAQAQSCTASCYAQTAAEKAAGVTPANTAYLPGNVLRYGAVGDGVTDCSTAFARAVAQAIQTGGSAVYVPGGQFVTGIVLPTTVNLRIYGDGPAHSALIAVSPTADVITVAPSAEYPGLRIENLSLIGSLSGPSGSGNGIHIPSTAQGGWSCRFANLVLRNFGNSGILIRTPLISTTVEDIWTVACLGHDIEMDGGSGLTFINCFPTNANLGKGTAGFRIHGAYPVFIGCNGIEGGDYWGIFSDTMAEDGRDLYCFPTIINCNVESFAVAGLRNKNTSFVLINTLINPTSGTVKGIVIDNQPNNLGLNLGSGFELSNNASWAHGQPIHCHGAPFIQVSSPQNNSAAPYQFFDELLNLVFTGPTLGFAYTAYERYSIAVSSLSTNESGSLLHALTSMANGAGTSAGTLTNAPAAGSPTKWIPIDDAGTTRYIPAW